MAFVRWKTAASGLFLAVGIAGAGSAASGAEILPQDSNLREISGVVEDPSGRGYWLNQDASAPESVSLVDRQGRTAAVVTPANGSWEDPEDGGVGPGHSGTDSYLYVADAGDAANVRKEEGLGSRTEYAIARTPLRSLNWGRGDLDVDFQFLRFVYPSGESRNNEAMIVDPANGDVWLVDKAREGGRAGVWRIGSSGFGSESVQTAVSEGELDLTGISGGGLDPFGRFAVLRDGQSAYLFQMPIGQSVGEALAGTPTRVVLPEQPQGEGIGVSNAGDELVLTSEGAAQPIRTIPIPKDFLASLPPAQRDELSTPAGQGVLVGAGVLAALGVAALVFGAVKERRTQPFR